MVPHSFLAFFPNQLGFYVIFNVVKLMFIAFFFTVCENDTVQLLYILTFLWKSACDEL